jgi:predicted enzyme related to lactoylglutathione lyase
MDERTRTYPHGVTSWVDTEQPDPEAAGRFYGELLGWELTEAMPAGAPGSYLIATLDGADAAAIAPGEAPARWNTYVAVDDCDATAAAATAAGGEVALEPVDAGPGGRTAWLVDPTGAQIRLWQARKRLGAQVANVPGAWNFSILHTDEGEAAMPFYSAVFGWERDDSAVGMIRVPGYGEHLATTIDPGIRERQADAPPGFTDVTAGLAPAEPGTGSRWVVNFTVADRDEARHHAERLGAEVVSSTDTPYTREAHVLDPQGAELVLSQYTPGG